MKRAMWMLTALALLVGRAGQATAGYVVDQSSPFDLHETASAWGINFFTPIGQSFVPTTSTLNHVQLWIYFFTFPPGPDAAADMHVDIHANSITGTIVGTSSELTIPYNAPEQKDFSFSSPVSLTPGNTYVMQLIQDSGPLNYYVLGPYAPPSDVYPAGQFFLSGVGSSSNDLFFTEGNDISSPAAVPEPASLTLCGMALFTILGYFGLRRQKPAIA